MIKLPEPELQVTFAKTLAEIRGSILQNALRKAVKKLNIVEIDGQLAAIVPQHSLSVLASHGLRGEYFFPIPLILTENPRLLGYYRLLYGYSQKEFYKAPFAGAFKSMEMAGKLGQITAQRLDDLCRSMSKSGGLLLAAISTEKITASLLDDLTLLTLGPQFRGGANVKLGTAAIAGVFGMIREVVSDSIEEVNPDRIRLKNAAGRIVLIEFASDPDIIIREQLPSGEYRHVVAIEVKGGRDFSNVYNRIGEAEKSHQKARTKKYTECWTVVNIDNIDLEMAQKESPSTDRFYRLSNLIAALGAEYDDFRERVISLTGTK